VHVGLRERSLPVTRHAIAAVVIVGCALASRADAYPQYQLSRDQTCTSCHTSPAGGGILTENGYAVAESTSQYGTPPEFMYGKIPMPSWLALGGDLRGVCGPIRTPQDVFTCFPMQADLYAEAKYKGISLHVTAGYRPSQWNNTAVTHVWSREHYVQWRSDPDGSEGLFVRAGRFMPVFGLRFAEHPDYTRRYGGTQLYSETYGLAVEYVSAKVEAHATGFIEDPILDPVEHYNGAAVYAEMRPADGLAVGVEGMAKLDSFDHWYRGGVTAKYYLKGPDILFQGEGQYAHHYVHDNGYYSQLVGYLMGTWFIGKGLMLDLGIGHFAENVRIKDTFRDCVDVNFHWFTTSHVELILNTRYEAIAFGSGALSGAWALLQLHYRL
jgi:hypothetical protein